MSDTAIEMFVGGLVLDPNTQAPVVILKDEKGDYALPIWIGIAEATSIASAIKQVTMARPLTHDLMRDVFDELGVRVERVVVTDLKDSTYFAELVLSVGEKALIFDSRPSDAIAIALRASAPIYVTQQVLDQAKVTFSSMLGGEPPAVEGGAKEPGETPEGGEPVEGEPPPENDFRVLDKDKWAELLEKLNPDDFKFKM